MKKEILIEEVEALLHRMYDSNDASNYYSPEDPAILYRITLANGKQFEMILLRSQKEKIEESKLKYYINSISAVKIMLS